MVLLIAALLIGIILAIFINFTLPAFILPYTAIFIISVIATLLNAYLKKCKNQLCIYTFLSEFLLITFLSEFTLFFGKLINLDLLSEVVIILFIKMARDLSLIKGNSNMFLCKKD